MLAQGGECCVYFRKVSSKGKTIKLETLNNKDSEGLGCSLLYSYKHQVSFLFPDVFEYSNEQARHHNHYLWMAWKPSSSLAYWKPWF